jgi:peptidoglycan hydrolase CwlO-like protein
MWVHLGSRRGASSFAALVAAIGLLAVVPSSSGDLSSRARSLKQGIGADTARVEAYRGRVSDLEARLAGIESSLRIQRSLLVRIEHELAAARDHLTVLRGRLADERGRLAEQLVAQYESPTPNLVSVVLDAHGFADLLERVDQLKLIARRNAEVVAAVARAKSEVHAQTVRLADAQAHQRRVIAAVAVERDQVETLRLSVLEHERVAARDRARKQAELQHVQHEIAILQARAAAAQRASFASRDVASVSVSAGVGAGVGAGSDGGLYGFFPAPGTNYSVGEEPEIAARLDKLGKALHLHLIGLSGYRSPEHSVEVGGFADDPHTRGEASDTPGVEGVPEQTLLQFGLTRPFPGPAEADHIQLA